jgi:hypothetical protein
LIPSTRTLVLVSQVPSLNFGFSIYGQSTSTLPLRYSPDLKPHNLNFGSHFSYIPYNICLTLFYLFPFNFLLRALGYTQRRLLTYALQVFLDTAIMPNWKSYESSVRLLSAIVAAHPGLKLNYDGMYWFPFFKPHTPVIVLAFPRIIISLTVMVFLIKVGRP